MAGLSFRAVRACALAEHHDSLYIYHSSRALSKPPSQAQDMWLACHRWYSPPHVIFYQLRERGSSLRNPWEMQSKPQAGFYVATAISERDLIL